MPIQGVYGKINILKKSLLYESDFSKTCNNTPREHDKNSRRFDGNNSGFVIVVVHFPAAGLDINTLTHVTCTKRTYILFLSLVPY